MLNRYWSLALLISTEFLLIQSGNTMGPMSELDLKRKLGALKPYQEDILRKEILPFQALFPEVSWVSDHLKMNASQVQPEGEARILIWVRSANPEKKAWIQGFSQFLARRGFKPMQPKEPVVLPVSEVSQSDSEPTRLANMLGIPFYIQLKLDSLDGNRLKVGLESKFLGTGLGAINLQYDFQEVYPENFADVSRMTQVFRDFTREYALRSKTSFEEPALVVEVEGVTDFIQVQRLKTELVDRFRQAKTTEKKVDRRLATIEMRGSLNPSEVVNEMQQMSGIVSDVKIDVDSGQGLGVIRTRATPLSNESSPSPSSAVDAQSESIGG